ncbi:cAMP-dependent protein kinase type II-beta regulatory subunit [Podochytrium sp. JEL0797]|nr:cAMP-dependent protein kinase type II-beta regulatory subunit [Podochytrium sp. JEL0797]
MDPTKENATPFTPIHIPKTLDQTTRITTKLHNNILFRACDEDQLTNIIHAMSEKKVLPGEAVITQGAEGDFFYVIEHGEYDILVNNHKVHFYKDEGSFGELALMYNAPRAATIVATTEGALWALDRVSFRRLLMDTTNRKRRMYESFLEGLKLLSSLEAYERVKIADALESKIFNEGDVVIRQGDVGEEFYIIESGEARVTKMEDGVEKEYPRLKKGDYFGELALLTDQPRQATIRACGGRLKVATLGKAAFVRLLGPVVDIIKRNTENYESVKEIIA